MWNTLALSQSILLQVGRVFHGLYGAANATHKEKKGCAKWLGALDHSDNIVETNLNDDGVYQAPCLGDPIMQRDTGSFLNQ